MSTETREQVLEQREQSVERGAATLAGYARLLNIGAGDGAQAASLIVDVLTHMDAQQADGHDAQSVLALVAEYREDHAARLSAALTDDGTTIDRESRPEWPREVHADHLAADADHRADLDTDDTCRHDGCGLAALPDGRHGFTA